jgi:Bacterial extracellular solute-binding protein
MRQGIMHGQPGTACAHRMLHHGRTRFVRQLMTALLALGWVLAMSGSTTAADVPRISGKLTTFATRVLANLVSEETNVKQVASKVQLGEADAGIVYSTDVTPALRNAVRVMQISPEFNVIANYPMVAVKGARNEAGVRLPRICAFTGGTDDSGAPRLPGVRYVMKRTETDAEVNGVARLIAGGCDGASHS